MNNKAQYELTITEKLEQLSVPDAVDAIWARIETTLDLEMPTDDGPKDPPAGSPAGPGFWFGAIFLAALVSIIYFVNKNSSSPDTDSVVPSTPAVIQAPGSSSDKPPPTQTVVPNPSRSARQTSDPAVATPGSTGTTVQPGIDLLSPAPDSGSLTPDIPAPVISNPVQDSVPKKSRGVKGIKDADYRIEPTKKEGD